MAAHNATKPVTVKHQPAKRAAVYTKVDTHWFQDQLKARDRNQRDLAKFLELDPGAVSLMLYGRRKMTIEEATKLSAFLSQPLAEVVSRAGIKDKLLSSPNQVPIIGSVDGRGEVHIQAKPLGLAPRPPEMPGEGTAALLNRTSGTPRDYRDGWIFYYQQTHIVEPECIGSFIVAQIARGGPIVTRFARKGYQPKTFNLISNFEPPIESAQLDWAAPIRWIKS